MKDKCKCDSVSHIPAGDGREYAKSHLTEIHTDVAKWIVLYRCPFTGVYWKEFFPHPEAQAGGPSELTQISKSRAMEEFGLSELP